MQQLDLGVVFAHKKQYSCEYLTGLQTDFLHWLLWCA